MSKHFLLVVACLVVWAGSLGADEKTEKSGTSTRLRDRDEVIFHYLEGTHGQGNQRITFDVVGTTYDACDKDRDVLVYGRENGQGSWTNVVIKAGETKLVQLPGVMTSLYWKCGGNTERVANDRAFDWLTLERSSGTGRLFWTFLKARSYAKETDRSARDKHD